MKQSNFKGEKHNGRNFVKSNKMFRLMKCGTCGELFWKRCSIFEKNIDIFVKLQKKIYKTDNENPFSIKLKEQAWKKFLSVMGKRRTKNIRNTERAAEKIRKVGSEKVYKTFYTMGFDDGYMKAMKEYFDPENRKRKKGTIDGQQALKMLKDYFKKVCPDCRKGI